MPIKRITRGIPADRSFYARYGTYVVIVLLLLAPLVAWGMVKAATENNNNIQQWLPRDLPEREQYDAFIDRFGSDEVAIVSWEGLTLDDERELQRLEQFVRIAGRATTAGMGDDRSIIDHLADRVESIITQVPTEKTRGGGRLFRTPVWTGPLLIDRLTDEQTGPGVSRDEAIRRLRGIVIGQDDNTTAAVFRLTRDGSADRLAVMRSLEQAAESVGIPRDELRLGGGAVFNAALDVASQQAIFSLTWLVGLVSFVIALIALRSLRLTLIVAVVAGYAGALAGASVYYLGGQMNLVMVVLPVLVMVLTLSAGIHVINYYRDALEHGPARSAVRRAVRHGWWPCVLAAVTTAVGLFSLSVSHLGPVVDFARFGAMGVLLSLVFVLLLLPILLYRYPRRVDRLRELEANGGEDDDAELWRLRQSAGSRICEAIMRHRGLCVGLCLAIMLVAGWGVTRTTTSVRPGRFFPPDNVMVRDVLWLDREIGPLASVEILLTFNDPAEPSDWATFLRRLEMLHAMQRDLSQMDIVGGTISAASFGPELPLDASNLSLNPLALARAAERVDRLRDALLSQQYLHVDEQGEYWRLTARLPALEQYTYDELVERVEARVDEHLAALPPAQREQLGVTITGAVPLFYVAQKELLDGLFKSFLAAFSLIAVLMIILFRSVRAGLLSMLPNVLPALMIFGVMGWLGFAVDIGAMLTASVAMGIAVDDTLHFLTWFRRSLRGGASRHDAVVIAFHRCATAMMQTTAIAGLGMLVFFLSSFQPVAQFGLLMSLLLLTALVGDLIFLPALLATRLGQVFVKPAAAPRDQPAEPAPV